MTVLPLMATVVGREIGSHLSFAFDPRRLRRVGPMQPNGIVARSRGQVDPELRRMNPIAVDFFVLGSADIHAAAIRHQHRATVSAPNPAGPRTPCPAARRSLRINIILPAGITKNQPLRVCRAVTGTKTGLARRGGKLGGIDPNLSAARQRILLAAHDNFQFMQTIGQAILDKNRLFMSHGRIPTLHERRLFHTINESIRPATVGTDHAQQPHLIAVKMESHCRVRMIGRSE